MRFFTKYTYYAIILFACIHFCLYFGVYQIDAILFYVDKDDYMVTNALIVDETFYKDSWRNDKPFIYAKRGEIEYTMQGEKYVKDVFLDFLEQEGDSIRVAVRKEDYSDVKRCEFLLLKNKGVIGMAFLYIIIMVGGLLYYINKQKHNRNIIEITTKLYKK